MPKKGKHQSRQSHRSTKRSQSDAAADEVCKPFIVGLWFAICVPSAADVCDVCILLCAHASRLLPQAPCPPAFEQPAILQASPRDRNVHHDEQLDKSGFHPQLYIKGLVNREHACYFNSLLQLLASSAHLNAPATLAAISGAGGTSAALASVLGCINTISPDHAPQQTWQLLQQMSRKCTDMDGRTQQDSHEALMVLFDLLESESKKHAKAQVEPSSEAGVCNNLRACPSPVSCT